MEMFVIALIAVLAFAAVLGPLFRRGTRTAADEREFDVGHADDTAFESALAPMTAGPATPMAPIAPPSEHPHHEPDEIEREVLRYREGLRAGTVCMKCGAASPAESAYCGDCGKRLPLVDAREFE
jgi:hypothetical protein